MRTPLWWRGQTLLWREAFLQQTSQPVHHFILILPVQGELHTAALTLMLDEGPFR
jgi:hypothetical protein